MLPGPPRSTLFPYTTLFRSMLRTQTYPHQDAQGLCSFAALEDRKSTRLNSSHTVISYAVFCLKKKDLTFWGIRFVLASRYGILAHPRSTSYRRRVTMRSRQP